jgi:O-antigen/teichoic acid export membrane protein
MSETSDTQLNAKEHPDLYRKALRGGLWLMAERVTAQVLSFVRLLVLARLLPPREFGVLGIAMLLLQILETFTQTGFNAALVQRKEEDVGPFLNTAWTVNVLRGVVLFLIFVGAAPLAIQFFDGDGSFRPTDFHKPAELAAYLVRQDEPLAAHVMELLTDQQRQQIAAMAEGAVPVGQAQQQLSDLFNRLAETASLYQPEAFEQVSLSPYARQCVASMTAQTQRRTYRLLLEQAWPGWISRSILDRPQLLWIIRVVGIVLLFRAFSNPAKVYFTKALRFDKLFVLRTSATLVNVTVTVVLAFVVRNVWALVWGIVLSEMTSLVLSYVLQPWRPRFEWDRSRLGQMWRFGRWITGLSMLDFLLNTGDSVIVGRLLGASSLGLYQMALRLSELPIREFTSVIASVTFPAFCRIQTDIARLREAFLKSIDLTSVVVMPAVGGILIFADDIVGLFMQDSWQPMISTLRILAIFSLYRTLPVGALFQALGKPHYLTLVLAARVLFIGLLFYPLIQRYGLDGMAWTIGLSSLIVIVPGYWLMARLLHCSVRVILSRQAAQAAGVAAMMAVIGVIKWQFWAQMTYLRFFVLAASGCAIYLAVCLVLTPVFKTQWLAFVMEQWRQLKHLTALRASSFNSSEGQ